MTLKQFMKAAIGIGLALLVNSMKLIFFIKWPLILIFAGGGLLLAFVPFQDRPLENWILSFIKSIYSPTIFLYKKRAVKNWLDLDMAKARSQMASDSAGRRDVNAPDTRSQDQNPSAPINIGAPPLEKREVLKETKKVEKIEETEPAFVKATAGEAGKEDWREKSVDLGLKSEKLEATGKVIFGTIPMPDIPDISNIVVGMATDNEGKIIEEVIVEIQDEHGNPSRVLKTNSLGQFKTSTQLANGRYLLICEKEGYKFDRINIDVVGEIIKPIKLIASKI